MPPFQKLTAVGESLNDANQNAVSIEVLQTAIDLQPLDTLQQQRVLLLIADSHFTLGELDQAKEKYRQCLALALQDANQQYEAKSYRKLAEISLRQSDLQQGKWDCVGVQFLVWELLRCHKVIRKTQAVAINLLIGILFVVGMNLPMEIYKKMFATPYI